MAMRVKERKERKRNYRWYLEPLNNETKEDLLREASEEHIYPGRVCADGKPHDLCEVPWKKISFYLKSRTGNSFLQFVVWVQEGGGEIRRYPFQNKDYRQRKLTRGLVRRAREAFPERPI